MLRSLRVLLLTILVSLSLPFLHCSAQEALAPSGDASPLRRVEVRLQNAGQPTLTPTSTAAPSPTPSSITIRTTRSTAWGMCAY